MIIGIHGQKQSGKSTLQNMLWHTYYPHIDKLSFASNLKKLTSSLLNIDINLWEDNDFKNSVISKEHYIKLEKFLNFQHPSNYRKLIQVVGTDLFRNIENNVWINMLQYDIDNNCKYHVISDVRFLNELEFIKNQPQNFTIKIKRPSEEIDNHSSEILIDDEQFDYVINNNGTLEDFYKQCEIIENLIRKKYADS